MDGQNKLKSDRTANEMVHEEAKHSLENTSIDKKQHICSNLTNIQDSVVA